MDHSQSKTKAMKLKQVLEAADRAAEQVSTWPDWKRELSAPQVVASEFDEATSRAAAAPATRRPNS
jgi:hypothetical protein